jgi:hypothetical protein
VSGFSATEALGHTVWSVMCWSLGAAIVISESSTCLAARDGAEVPLLLAQLEYDDFE